VTIGAPASAEIAFEVTLQILMKDGFFRNVALEIAERIVRVASREMCRDQSNESGLSDRADT
jgi:hypothetical protein